MRNRFAALTAMFAGVLFAASTFAEAPPLQLLLDDSLIGWDYGEDLAGWTIHDGELTGSAMADPLVGGWSFADFEMEVVFSAPAGSGVLLSFPVLSDSKLKPMTYSTLGKEGEETNEGRLTIKRRSGELSIHSDSGKHGHWPVPPNARLGVSLAVLGKLASISSITVREPTGEPIFNEKDLSGWWTPGKIDAWKVEGNELVKRGGGGNYLRTKKEYGNFTLSLEYKITKGGNSGIGIRTKPQGWPSGDGMELQLLDKPSIDKSSTMAIYRNVPPLAAAHKSEEWNHAVVRAEGFVISAWINGRLVQHADTARHPELKHRHLTGWIGFQDHGGVDQFRNIRLVELPEGRFPLKQWGAKRKPTATELVLDRILNYEVLARQDGLKSYFTTAETAGRPDQVLATFTGPGALVRIGYDTPQTKLALFFDDEEKARVHCTAGELAKNLPKLTGSKQPCLTCATFAKKLRIEAADAKAGAKFSFASVRLPPDTPIESFVDSQTSIPRGWLATVDYRHHHHRFGTHRETDPLPRKQSQQVKIEPGSAAPLIEIDGAAVVQWLKVSGSIDKLFANDDLWLEVKIDGEKEPAIFAPARYLLAMVQDGKNYNNLLMLNRGGLVSRLAIPFGDGFAVVAHNKGKKPIGPVGATVSYRRAHKGEDLNELMRLRGKFFFGQGGTPKPFEWRISGNGRLVGIVAGVDKPGMISPKPGDLGIDGVTAYDWLIRNFNDSGPPNAIGFPINKPPALGYLSGSAHGLSWRYPLLAPIDFSKSCQVNFRRQMNMSHLLLYYAVAEQ